MSVSWRDGKNKADERRREGRGGQMEEEQAKGGDSREWVLRVEQV